MASLDKVAERYRAQQAASAAKTALKVGQYWKGVEIGNTDSERNFVELSTSAVSAGWIEQTDRARDFIRERVSALAEPVLPNEDQIRTSLGYVGPIQARRAMRAGDYFDENFTSTDPKAWRRHLEDLEEQRKLPAQAREQVAKSVRGAAVRLSGVGSREMATSIVAQSGARIGYMRVTGTDPCYFCVMLASRGPDFGKDSFDWSNRRFSGPGNARVHDSCKCQLILITTSEVDQLSQWREHEQTWADLSGKDPKRGESVVNTFRRNYEAMQRGA